MSDTADRIEYFQRRALTAESELRALRAGITALADEWERLRTFVYNSTWYAAHARALLAPTPTTGEHDHSLPLEEGGYCPVCTTDTEGSDQP